MAEEAAVNARDEATRYKDEANELDKGNRQVESDLAATRGNYARMKEELLNSEIVRGAMEEAEKKAYEDLEKEHACSCSLSDNVDRLRKALREKEEAILQSGKLIKDLSVEKIEMAHSYKRIERANTDLVRTHPSRRRSAVSSLLPYACFFCRVCF